MNFHKSINNLISIESNIKSNILNSTIPKIIAVSKTFPIIEIIPLIDHGHIHYGENKVQEALDKLIDNRTSLIIAHRLSTIKKANIIHVLSNGEIIESGSHDELMQKKGHYYTLSTMQGINS